MSEEKDYLNKQYSYHDVQKAIMHRGKKTTRWVSTKGWYFPCLSKYHAAKVLSNLVKYSAQLATERDLKHPLAFSVAYDTDRVTIDQRGRITRDAEIPELNYWVKVIANALKEQKDNDAI